MKCPHRIIGQCRSCANINRTGTFKWKKSSVEDRKLEKNPNWKGDNVSYAGLHDFIKFNKSKSEICENCKKKKKVDLSNLSQKYTRDLNDWKWLCRSCHMKFDFKCGKRISRGKKN